MNLDNYTFDELIELKNEVNFRINSFEDGYFYICDVRSDTTTRTFLESMLKTVAQEIFEEGGTPKMLVVPPGLKATKFL